MSVVSDARWTVVGPLPPLRGGIARHTSCLVDAAVDAGIDVDATTFRRLYPRWLYRGETDRDPSRSGPQGHALLDSVAPWTWWRTARRIARRRPDVVVLVWWHPFFAPLIAVIAALLRRWSPATRLVALCHNVVPHEPTRADGPLTRLALGRVDAIVVHSTSEAEAARRLRLGAPITVTPHPTYALDRGGEVGAAAGDGPARLLFFGLVRAYKGLDVLLDALPHVLQHRDAHLVVAGEFWEPVEEFRGRAERLGVAPHVDLRPGFVAEDALGELFAAADLVVAPYRAATQSGVVEMAFGAGVPVVVTDVGGLADQVTPGVNGEVAAPEDPAALADAIVAATEPDHLATLADGARSSASVRPWSDLVDAIGRAADEVEGR